MCGFFKRDCLGLQQFLPPTQSPLVFASRSCGDLSSWHWNPGMGDLVWVRDSLAGTTRSQDIPPKFLSTTRECRTSPFHICAPPTSLDGYGFFNSTVVRLSFNSISASSVWWLFCILVLILMWLCEEKSYVCLCCHLDWKSLFIFRERGRDEEREGQKHQCARETLISCLSHTRWQGTWPATQACALTGNQTGDLSVYRLAFNPLSHNSQGKNRQIFF